jgi:signal transduction histidine kinase
MFVNFIRNAVQAQADELTFTLTEENDTYTLIIADNGTGIPAGMEEKIFESNFTTKSQGMGLGLKLAKRYLESIGGTIKLDTSRARGIAFIIAIKKAG